MKTKRRATAAAVSAALAAVLLVGFTAAYLTDTRAATNTLGLGADADGTKAVMISLREESFAAHGEATYLEYGENEIVTGSVQGLLPGDNIYKDPTITNVGTQDVYVRVKIDMHTNPALNKAFAEKLSASLGLAVNGDFVYNDTDGYYYYGSGAANTPLSPGQSVDFFALEGTGTDRYSMTVPTAWKNSDVESFLKGMDAPAGQSSFDIPIVVQAIQAEGFTAGIPWGAVDIEAVVHSHRDNPYTP